MKKFTGIIKTSVDGSDCKFEFEVPDDATQDEIEEEAKQAAFNLVEWHYKEI